MARNGAMSAAFERRLRRRQRLLSALRIRFDVSRMIEALLPPGVDTFEWDAPETLAASIPAANGLFTARSLAKLYAVLAAGGQWHGRRLLSEATLARATEVQTRRMDLVVPFPMHWRLAVSVGFVGAYTTFSTFEYETFKLLERGNGFSGLLNVAISLMLGFFAVWGGIVSARSIEARFMKDRPAAKVHSIAAEKSGPSDASSKINVRSVSLNSLRDLAAADVGEPMNSGE